MKRLLSLFLCLCLCGALLVPFASAAETDLTYDLAVDVGDGATVTPGSLVTVTFTVKSEDAHKVSVLQNEIVFDQAFYSYVPGSATTVKGGSNALYQTRTDGTHIIKASYFSPNGGSFAAEEVMCTFQLRVIGTSGSGWIRCDKECAKAYNEQNEACVINASSEPTISASGPCHTFTDVAATDWFHEAVDYVTLRGYMNGTGNNQFSPNATMTRAMVVTGLYRLSGSPAVTSTNPYSDVQSGQWYTDAIIWANENSIVNGIGNGKFGTNNSITREQLAAIMYRYCQYRGVDVAKTCSLAHFTDADTVSAYADSAIRWANTIGLITGRTATTLAPTGTATRAEVAIILMRLCENVLN